MQVQEMPMTVQELYEEEVRKIVRQVIHEAVNTEGHPLNDLCKYIGDIFKANA